jgi:hypothetical protein
MKNPLLIVIPFQGFYESIHDHAITYAAECFWHDEHGDTVETPEAESFFNDFRATKPMLNAYCKEYVQAFNSWVEEETDTDLQLQFHNLVSPREYNFETDRIFCQIPKEVILRMLAETEVSGYCMEGRAKHYFTSHCGFVSFYDPDYHTWPDSPAHWDHNQLKVLLEAWLETNGVGLPDEAGLMEDARGNGLIDDLVFRYMPLELQALVNTRVNTGNL